MLKEYDKWFISIYLSVRLKTVLRNTTLLEIGAHGVFGRYIDATFFQ